MIERHSTILSHPVPASLLLPQQHKGSMSSTQRSVSSHSIDATDHRAYYLSNHSPPIHIVAFSRPLHHQADARKHSTSLFLQPDTLESTPQTYSHHGRPGFYLGQICTLHSTNAQTSLRSHESPVSRDPSRSIPSCGIAS